MEKAVEILLRFIIGTNEEARRKLLYEHIAEESDMLADIEEGQSVFESIVPDEEAYLIGRFRLEIAVFNVKNLVEETAYMESQTVFLLF